MSQLTLPYTPEISRIAAIPRRVYTAAEIENNRVQMTRILKRPAGSQQLFAIQALALTEIGINRGLFGNIRVGDGKTLIGLLAPVVTQAKRPLLLIRANLKDKTRRDTLTYSVHWNVAKWIRVESYDMLGRKQAAEMLDQYRPDLIIADEAHRLRNLKAACTRRVDRYMREYPSTMFVGMSGTMTSKSLEDYAHLLRWSLGQNAPIPKASGELMQWCDVLDNHGNPAKRMHPGAMVYLDIGDLDVDPSKWRYPEKSELNRQWNTNPTAAGRAVYRKRLEETPGVVFSRETKLDCPLIITTEKVDLETPLIQAFRTLRNDWRTPDDWPISDGLAMRRHAYELALGFYSVWSPRPPDWWIEPRKAWCSECRAILSHSKSIDSESQLIDHINSGNVRSLYLDPWSHVKDHWKLGRHYRIEPRWLSNQLIEWCAGWMSRPGIVWTEHVAFAERLAYHVGAQYYGREGKNSAGTPIEAADPTRAIVASRPSNGEGRNLQMYSRNLVVAIPANAQICEQLFGRTHRPGQRAHEVTAKLLLSCIEHHLSLEASLAYSKVIQATMPGTDNLKLLTSDCVFHGTSELANSTEPQWQKTLDE